MDDQPTCGIGLAAHAVLPDTVGELIAAMAAVLDEHQRALDLTDERARPEHHAYVTLALELRSISAQLGTTARRMTGYRDLPMGRHDERVMAGPDALATLERFVRAERTLLSLLTAGIEEHGAMLEQIRAPRRG